MHHHLENKVAIVTGAGQGLGEAIARTLAAAGVRVGVNDLNPDRAERVSDGIKQAGGQALAVTTDVTNSADLERLVDATLEAFGRLDLLVNNVGGTGPRPALETSEKYFESALRINVTQAFLLTRLAVPRMLESAGGGAIVNISSRSSDMVQTSFVAYGAAKAALNMMTRNLAPEIAPKVRINAISVGGVGTESLEVVLTNDALREQFDANTPMKRPGRVDVKIPLFPAHEPEESYQLIRALGRKHDLDLPDNCPEELVELVPSLVTPGAAESIAVKMYRHVKTKGVGALEALKDCLDEYQNPIPQEVMDFQIGLAVKETSDLEFGPNQFRKFGR